MRVRAGEGDSTVTITIDATNDVLSGGVEVNDSAGRRDHVVVLAIQKADVIRVHGAGVNVNGIAVETSGIKELVVNGRDGRDAIDGSVSTVKRLTIQGGPGADRVVGSPGGDVLVVNLDIDSVDGNGGDDRMIDELTGRRGERLQSERGQRRDTARHRRDRSR